MIGRETRRRGIRPPADAGERHHIRLSRLPGAVALGAPVANLTGVGAIGDGVLVEQVLDEHAVAVEPAGTHGPPVVLFVTDPLVAGGLVPGQLIAFEGTLMPAPPDFTAMAGAEAATIAGSSGVYVSVVPGTIGLVPPLT